MDCPQRSPEMFGKERIYAGSSEADDGVYTIFYVNANYYKGPIMRSSVCAFYVITKANSPHKMPDRESF